MPRHADVDERRREIAFAVWFLIATRGPDAVTLRAVASEAQISVGRIQHYFASKEEMVRDSCRQMVTEAGARYGDGPGAANPVEAIRFLLTQGIPRTDHARTAVAVWYAYLTQSLGDPEIAAMLLEAKRSQAAEVARLLSKARELEVIEASVDISAVADRLLAVADGLTLRVYTGLIEIESAEDLIGAELALLTRG